MMQSDPRPAHGRPAQSAIPTEYARAVESITSGEVQGSLVRPGVMLSLKRQFQPSFRENPTL
jgi:hypothetical protein